MNRLLNASQPETPQTNAARTTARRHDAALAALLCALLTGLLVTGCGDSAAASAANGSGAKRRTGPQSVAEAARGEYPDDDLTQATPYQTIPPAWTTPDSGRATTPGVLHWKADHSQPDAVITWVDCRDPELFAAERVTGARHIADIEWLGATNEFKCSAAWWQQRRLMPKDRVSLVVILGDNDRQCAPAWVMLQLGGQPPPRLVWQGLAAAKAAGFPTLRNVPEDPDDQAQIDAYSANVPPDPAWFIDSSTFAQMIAGLQPVSGGGPTPKGQPPAALPSTPGFTPAPTATAPDPAQPTPPPPSAPAIPEAPPAPGAPAAAPTAPAAPETRYVFCGSLDEWEAHAKEDSLLRGMVRIPPGEMYGETTGNLLTPERILARVAMLKLIPTGTYVLTGDQSESICAVYMALRSAGFNHLSLYFP